MERNEFAEGIKYGIPIGLGYLSVSFTFGMLAVSKGVPAISALFISMTNLTSAGQAAGLMVMVAGGSLIDLALCQLVINLRYPLMSLTVSQKLRGDVTFPQRFLIAFGITDEIFAVMAAREKPISKSFYIGIIILPYLGWSGGTFLGSVCGNLLPGNFAAVMAIALYGMFLAIIVPPAKHSKSVLAAVVLAAAISCVLYFVPWFSFISSGVSVIICAIITSAVCAFFFPIFKLRVDGENSNK